MLFHGRRILDRVQLDSNSARLVDTPPVNSQAIMSGPNAGMRTLLMTSPDDSPGGLLTLCSEAGAF